MKTEKLLDGIGGIDDCIIEEADTHSLKSVKHIWLRLTSFTAACVVIIVGLVAIYNHNNNSVKPVLSNLPMLTVSEVSGEFGGFEGYLAYDIGELQNGNPWTANNNLTTMPVFSNPNEYDKAGAPINGLSPEEMLAETEKIANLFDLKITSVYTEPTAEQIEQIKKKLNTVNASDEEVRQNTDAFRATAECNGAKIEVQKDGHILMKLTPDTAYLAKEIKKLSGYNSFTISFEYGYKTIGDTSYELGFPLPDGYNFSYENASYEQDMEITKYLFEEYGDFTGITTPGYDLFAHYTYNGVLSRLNTAVFENKGSLTERIMNYNFNNLYFYASDMGGLGGIGYVKTDLSKKIGDYPIITADEAQKLLLKKHYITTVPEELPNKKYIAHVELIYRTGRHDTVFMPYYKFWVELPTMQRENGLKNFGIFYVPAVKNEFLEKMPLWNGRFN